MTPSLNTKPKFKIGETIEAIEMGRGFSKALVTGYYHEEKGIYKGKDMYILKIMNGTAIIPMSAEVNYKLIKNKK